MIYCFDLDGTLCQTTGREYRDAQPCPARIAEVNRLYDEGHQIVIETARGSVTGVSWQAETERQLQHWGLRYHVVRAGQKVYADHYIDDKAQNAEDFFHACLIPTPDTPLSSA